MASLVMETGGSLTITTGMARKVASGFACVGKPFDDGDEER